MTDNVWIAAGQAGLFTPRGETLPRALLPDASLLAMGGGQLFCACRERCQVLNVHRSAWLPSAPGISAMCVSRDGHYLYQLSGDCDSLFCVDAEKAQPLFLNRCGCYPQSLHLHPVWPLLAAAAGATGEILLFEAPSLKLTGAQRVPGVASCAVFVPHGLVFLSAIEKGDICTLLGLIRHGGAGPEELAVFPGVPGSLLPLEDGTVMVSVSGALMRVALAPFRVLFSRYSDGLITGMACEKGHVLLCDSAAGQVAVMGAGYPYPHRICYEGDALHALFGPQV